MIRSCLLQILSLCYLLLLLSVFTKKRKEKSLENKNFEIFSILTFIVILFDGVKNYLLFFQDKYELLNMIICKGFLVSTIIWSTWLIIYISSLKKEFKTLKELFKSNTFYIILMIGKIFSLLIDKLPLFAAIIITFLSFHRNVFP